MTSTTGTRSGLRGIRWTVPLLAALLVGAIGWLVYDRVETATRQELTKELQAFLDADATALEIWIDARLGEAVAIAADSGVKGSVLELVGLGDAGAEELRAAPALATLRQSLEPLCNALGHDEFHLVAPGGRVIAAHEDARIGGQPSWTSFPHVARAFEGRRVFVPPFRPDSGPASAGNETAVLVIAPVTDGARVAAVLALRLDPRGDFARILGPARSGDSGETYAFDAQGLMLSRSRFADSLRELGLLPPGDSTAQLTFELRDPGGNLRAGYRSDVPRKSLPLTRLVGRASGGSAGVDVDGYRGYLGVPVIGAWTWLPDHDMGVATEIELDEAYGALHVLGAAFWAVFGLVVLGGLGTAFVIHRHALLESKVRDAERTAKTLGQYTLVKKIGEGGMGEVYFARHAMLRRPTAIKLLRPDRTSEKAIQRFEREVQFTSQLTHPNTIAIYDFGRTPGGLFYYAMEYLVGVSLQDFVDNEGPLPEGRVIYILQQVCASLNEAHGLGLIHRDIKPENIALCRTGGEFDVVKVLDFGLVMDTVSGDDINLGASGTIAGTPLYMSPEALTKPKTVDARSDLYALGAVAYFLLTGVPPFEGENMMELFNKHLKEKPVPPSERIDAPILPDLEQAVMACLEKSPHKRPDNANAFSRELEWCRSTANWNKGKARHWWLEHEERLDSTYGLSSKEPSAPSGPRATIAIDLKDRDTLDV